MKLCEGTTNCETENANTSSFCYALWRIPLRVRLDVQRRHIWQGTLSHLPSRLEMKSRRIADSYGGHILKGLSNEAPFTLASAGQPAGTARGRASEA